MPGNSIFRSFDVVFAGMIFLISSAGSVITYVAVQDLLDQSQIIHTSIAPGQHHFLIYSGDKCVGELQSGLSSKAPLRLQLSGRFDAELSGHKREHRFQLSSHFNPIGQMFEGEARLQWESGELSVHSKNVNPLELELTQKSGTQFTSNSLLFPGPFIASISSLDYLQIAHEKANNIPVEFMRLISQVAVSKLKLRIEKVLEDELSCSSEDIGTIDLDPVINLRGAVEKSLTSFESKGKQSIGDRVRGGEEQR